MIDDKPQFNTTRNLLKVIVVLAMTKDYAPTAFLDKGTIAYNICQFFGIFTTVIMCFFVV